MTISEVLDVVILRFDTNGAMNVNG